ncbi:unnamed protein product [Discosporangium mesarthrocarpum]
MQLRYSSQPNAKQIEDYGLPLVEAVRRKDCEALQEMVRKGVTMGASNRFGESIMHLATRRGNVKVLNFLLVNGGSLHICDDYGKTPMHDACWTSEPPFDVVSLMLSHDPWLLQATDVRGATPLRYAKRQHWEHWCNFLDRVKDTHWPELPGSGGRGAVETGKAVEPGEAVEAGVEGAKEQSKEGEGEGKVVGSAAESGATLVCTSGGARVPTYDSSAENACGPKGPNKVGLAGGCGHSEGGDRAGEVRVKGKLRAAGEEQLLGDGSLAEESWRCRRGWACTGGNSFSSHGGR